MRQGRTGFSLIELVVSMAALAFIFAIVFLLFTYGHNGYAALNARQGVQASALKARLSLERDLGLSHFDSVGVVNRVEAGEERDIACLLALSNWNDDSLFAANGFPKWDREVVYYATLEPRGRLMRAVLEPPIPSGLSCLRIAPMDADLLSTVEQDSPPSELCLAERQEVIRGVREFSVTADETHQLITVRLLVRDVSGRRPGQGSARVEEDFEAVFQLDPLNTSPRF